MNPPIIAVDAMGGDLGPAAIIDGVIQAAQVYPDIRLVLVGSEELIQTELRRSTASGKDRISILPATEIIEPHETPTTAIKQKKDSSMVVGLRALKEGQVTCLVSTGNTGALLTGAVLIVGRQKGIERPALGALLPTRAGRTLLLDCGANVDAKPSYLLQFGEMGADYVRRVMGIARPRVGLVNVGAEKEKGNELTKATHDLLAASDLNFIGNIEGRDIPKGAADVAVCDAFVGNVVLKFMAGFGEMMQDMIKEELMTSAKFKIGGLLAKGAFRNLKKRLDSREVGGAPFLGLNALVVKAHGNSDALAVKNAIRQCVEYQKEDN